MWHNAAANNSINQLAEDFVNKC